MRSVAARLGFGASHRPAGLSWLAALLAAALGGVGLATGQALGGSGWTLAAVPAACTVLAVRGRSPHRLVGWLALSAGCLAPHLQAGWPSRLFVLAVAGALFDAGLQLGVPTYLARGGSSFVVALGAGLARATAELVWSRTPLGDAFCWGQHLLDWTLLAQITALLDLSGLGVLLVFAVTAVTIVAVDAERVAARRTTGLGLALLALALGHGAGRLERQSGETLAVAAVGATGNTRTLLFETAEASSRLADVIVWPASALELDELTDPRTLRELATTARAGGSWIVTTTRRPGGSNVSLLVAPDGGTERAPYVQHHAPRRPELGGGTAPPWPEPTAFGGLARLLGDDLLDAELARLAYERGATVLAVSADAGSSAVADPILLARARAVSNTLLVVLATRGGSSALIDPFGRVTAQVDIARQPGFVLAGEVPLVRDIQPGLSLRRAFPSICLVSLILLLALRPSAGALDAGPWEPLFRYDG